MISKDFARTFDTLTQQKSNIDKRQKRKYKDIDNSTDEINENTINVTGYFPNITSNRKRKIDLSSQIEIMNNNTLDVLKSIDSNIGSIATDLKNFVSLFPFCRGQGITFAESEMNVSIAITK